MRDLDLLPKAHLHLHFTGSLRVATLRDLGEARGARLPETLLDGTALSVPADRRGWFRFQRNYDLARAVVQRGIADTISKSTIGRFLKSGGPQATPYPVLVEP